jgi:hypothetical protein
MPLTMSIEGHGSLSVSLNDHRHAPAVEACFAKGARARLHRAEPLPPEGSVGPPYGLVQMSLEGCDELRGLAPGGVRIQRGDLCLIGGAADLFVSLARNGEHDGWEGGMTVVGRVEEPGLTEIAERRLLELPKRNSTHPSGVIMSMLAAEIPVTLSKD